jgi:hypothetical protein
MFLHEIEGWNELVETAAKARKVRFERPISSWVHDWIVRNVPNLGVVDNRPQAARCTHPWVTCLKTLEAIDRKFERGNAAATFVRHYRDVAQILRAAKRLPRLARALPYLAEQLRREDRKIMPSHSAACFRPDATDRFAAVRAVNKATGAMYWGERIPLDDACQEIRAFLRMLSVGAAK